MVMRGTTNPEMVVRPFALHRERGLNDAGVYGIYSTKYHQWFRWCYRTKKRADDVAGRLVVDDRQDLNANWVHDPQDCTMSSNERNLK